MSKNFLLAILTVSLVLTASTVVAKSKSEIMQLVNECIEDHFNDDSLRDKYTSEISRNDDGSYSLYYGNSKMRFLFEKKGKPSKNGKFPLYITLHGGGGTTSEVNDDQWRQMFSYYKGSVKTEFILHAEE